MFPGHRSGHQQPLNVQQLQPRSYPSKGWAQSLAMLTTGNRSSLTWKSFVLHHHLVLRPLQEVSKSNTKVWKIKILQKNLDEEEVMLRWERILFSCTLNKSISYKNFIQIPSVLSQNNKVILHKLVYQKECYHFRSTGYLNSEMLYYKILSVKI